MLAARWDACARAAPPFDGDPFSLGVASGDPLPGGVVLWTRLAPDPLTPGGGMTAEPYGVRFEVATDQAFTRIVRRGAVEALPEEAHSARVELEGLAPGAEYFYRFKFGTAVSPVGRTRTAPAAARRSSKLRFAFASCQNFPVGYFNSYADVVAQDVDFVVHLGDYIYEGPAPACAPTRRRRRSSRSTTTGSATASTRPTSTCRPRTPRSRGWSRGTTTRSTTTTPTRRPTRTRRARRSSPAAPRPTRRTGSTCRCGARASRSAPT